jgi:hypothetical protein
VAGIMGEVLKRPCLKNNWGKESKRKVRGKGERQRKRDKKLCFTRDEYEMLLIIQKMNGRGGG